MRRARAVLVDLYGTLVHDDGEPLAAACCHLAARARHLDPALDPAALREAWDARLWELAEPAHGAGFRGLFELTAAALGDVLAERGLGALPAGEALQGLRLAWRRPPAFPDAHAFLDAVRAAGLPVCLVSDADRADVEAVLGLHGLVLDAVVTSEDARAYKPRPEPFARGLAALGVAAGEAVHVGDSLACDVEGARAMGISAVHLQRGGTAVPDLAAAARVVLG
ncbi:MAG: HAD family hydrolase [Kineosporiaceae bacterium]